MYSPTTAANVANDYESDVLFQKKRKCSCTKFMLFLCCFLLTTGVVVGVGALFLNVDDLFGNDEDNDNDGNDGNDNGEIFEAQQLDESLTVNGIERNFSIFVPASYFETNEEVPLIFVFHGLTSNRAEVQAAYALEDAAERENFIAVFPDGINNAWDILFLQNNVDLPFVSAMLDFMKTEFRIKEESVYSTGHSNGAFFSTVIACALPDDFAAVAPVAGGFVNTIVAACVPNPMPYFQIHGTADFVVPIEGLDSLAAFDPALAAFAFESTDFALEFWAAANDLNTTPIVNSVSDGIDRFLFPEANTVQHLRLDGVGHFLSQIGAVVDIIEEVLDFFQEVTDF